MLIDGERKKERKLTNNQQLVLDIYNEFTEKADRPPSVELLAKCLPLSFHSIYSNLRILRKRGLLKDIYRLEATYWKRNK